MATEESAPNGGTAPSDESASGTDGAPSASSASAADGEPGGESASASAADGEPASAADSPPGGEPASAADSEPGGDSVSGEQTARELADAGAEALTEAAFRTGDFGRARELLQKARDDAAAAGDRETEALAIERLGMAAHYENITKLIAGDKVTAADTDAEEKLFRQALAIWQELGDQAGTARSAFGVGLVFQVLHEEWASAMPYFWQALDLSRALEERGDLYARSEIHRHVGFYYHVEAEVPGEAIRHLQLSLDLREEHGDPRLVPSGLVALGKAELAAGNHERAVELLTRAVAESRAAGLQSHRVEDAERALREAEAAAAGS